MRRLRFTAALLLTMLPVSAHAIDKIDSPNVSKGELDLEYSGSAAFDNNRDKNNLHEDEALVAYAPTDRWEFDVGGFFSRDAGQTYDADGVLLENIFQLTDKGANWMDAGLMLTCNCSTRNDLDTSLEGKLLLEKQIGEFDNVANIGLVQAIGSDGKNGPGYSFQWSTAYNILDNFQAGIEVQSDLGSADHALRWRDEQNYVGPALYGDVFDTFHYELAYLAGVSSASSSSAVRFLFQYRRQF